MFMNLQVAKSLGKKYFVLAKSDKDKLTEEQRALALLYNKLHERELELKKSKKETAEVEARYINFCNMF